MNTQTLSSGLKIHSFGALDGLKFKASKKMSVTLQQWGDMIGIDPIADKMHEATKLTIDFIESHEEQPDFSEIVKNLRENKDRLGVACL